MSDWAKDNHQKWKLRMVVNNTAATPASTARRPSKEGGAGSAATPINPYPCAWATIPPDPPKAA